VNQNLLALHLRKLIHEDGQTLFVINEIAADFDNEEVFH